eukprot:SAG11_NODE_46022_length_139_cov_484.700000_1_plen_28_part_10
METKWQAGSSTILVNNSQLIKLKKKKTT